MKASLTAGTGTTIDPIMGHTATPVATQVILQNGTKGVDIDLQPEGGAAYYLPTGVLYGQAICDAAADNVTAWEILIERA